MGNLEDKELGECINYSLARNGAKINHISHPEINCGKCKDAYDIYCPRYTSKDQFLLSGYDLKKRLSN